MSAFSTDLLPTLVRRFRDSPESPQAAYLVVGKAREPTGVEFLERVGMKGVVLLLSLASRCHYIVFP